MRRQIATIVLGSVFLLGVSLLIWLAAGGYTPETVPVSVSSSLPSVSEPDASSSSQVSEPETPDASSSSQVSEPDASSESEAVSEIPDEDVSETRAMWISYIDFMTLTTGQNESGFRDSFGTMLDDCAAIGINALYVHVRPFGDAMYRSSLFPWSLYASGKQGDDPGYDPLGIMVELAHARGMAIHAWINPLRISRDANAVLSPDNIGLQWFETGDGRVREVNGGLYYNPACPEVAELLLAGVREILDGYAVDGIQIDDYFYPTTDESFDAEQYAGYLAGGGTLALEDYRRDVVDRLVAGFWSLCHEYGRPFSVSPAGNPEYCYAQLYADIAKWCREPGYVDVVIPQIYWGFEHPSRPFAETLREWMALADGDTALVAGLAAYKSGTEDNGTEWIDNTDVLARQVLCCRENGAAGWALFRYGSLYMPTEAVADSISGELAALADVLEEPPLH